MLTVFTATLTMPGSVYGNDTVDSLKSRLSAATTTGDSISIMYDIFDAGSRNERAQIAWQMLDVAERTGNHPLGLEMIRHLANTYFRNDSIFAILEARATTYPPGDDRTATETFIALRRAEYIARCASEADRLEKIRSAITDYRNNNGATPYQRVQQLGTLGILLGNHTHLPLVADYIDRSIEEVNNLPQSDFAIRNIIYNQAINVYTNLNESKKAIALDNEMLRIMDNMTDEYHSRGRKYRNFDTIRFVTYRNMLQNYDGLTDSELHAVYDSITSIAARNDEVARALKLKVVDAYYMMGTRRYADAIRLFKDILTRPTDNFNRMRMLSNVIKAAKATGDKETLLTYTSDYNQQLEDYVRLSAAETYNELLAIYDVTQLQMRNTRLELEHARAKVSHQRTLLIGGIILFVVMAGVIIILIKVTQKSRRLAGNLTESNTALQQERTNLMGTRRELIDARDEARSAEQHKAKFIENMSDEITKPLDAIVEYSNLIVECADSQKRKYLNRYAEIVKLNTEILSNTVHDLLQVRLLENPSFTLNHQPVLTGDICRKAIDRVKPYVQPGVDISFEHGPDGDFLITTDGDRVEQVLVKLLSNAAKFTPSGKISLSYTLDRENNFITFAVTDTGIGIPAGKEEEIFDRFRKLHNDIPGSGLGLPICRMIASLLHGTVTVDTSYRGNGARFLFAIPVMDIIPE